MNVLLVNPSDLHNRRYVILPNVGLGYIAASLIASGHKVEIWDEWKENGNLDKFKNKLVKVKNDFDLIGFYFATPHYSAILRYLQLIKSINDKIITVVGGPHPTVDPLGVLRDIKDIDFAIAGEGEEALAELIAAIERKINFEDVYNLAWRQDGKIKMNKRKFLNDLNKIPMPAWHLLRPDTYPLAPNTIFTKKKKIAPVVLTRGCPSGCNFCAASIISGGKVRHRNLENVAEEFFLLKSKYHIEEIHLMDDAVTVDRNYIKLFCEMFIKHKMGIYWACPNGVRLDTLDNEIIRLMEMSGCYSISVGIESGVQRILDLMGKNILIEKIKEKIDLVKRVSSIRITGFFIMGYPEETLLDMQKTIDFACSLKIDRANFFNFTPFPGSAVYNKLKFDRSIYDKLYLYSIPITFGNVPPQMLKKNILKANIKFYSRPKIIFELLKEIKSFYQVLIIIRRINALLKSAK